MAGKPKDMSSIKQLLTLHHQGQGIKPIARTLGISKNTVKSYLHKVNEGPKSIVELLTMELPELEVYFHPGNPMYKELTYEHLKGKLPYYAKELKKSHFIKFRIYISIYEVNCFIRCIIVSPALIIN